MLFTLKPKWIVLNCWIFSFSLYNAAKTAEFETSKTFKTSATSKNNLHLHSLEGPIKTTQKINMCVCVCASNFSFKS